MSSFASQASAGEQPKNHRRRNSSLLEHINLSPGIKKIAADLLKQNAKQQQQQKLASQQRKRGNGRRKYNHHNKRGTISMAEFKEMNSNNRVSRTSGRSSRTKSKGTEIKFKPFRFTNGTSSRVKNNAFLYLSQTGKKVYKKDIHVSTSKNGKTRGNRKGKLLPSAYRITRDQRHAFFRAEQRHEVLMKPWRGLNKRKYIRDKDRVATKWLNRSLPPKLINSLEKSKRGHLFDVLEIANECAYLKVQDLKTATVGNDYVQSLIDGVIYYTGEPSVLHHRAKKVQKTVRKMSKQQQQQQQLNDSAVTGDGKNFGTKSEELEVVEMIGKKTSATTDPWGEIVEDDEEDENENINNNDDEGEGDINNDTFIEKDEDVEDDDFDFGNGDLDLQISSIENKDNSNDVVDFGDEEEEEEEILQLAIKKTSSSTENNMVFDEKSMSWKAIGEKAQKEEEDMMAGFDDDSGDDDDDDDDDDWG